MRNNDIQRIVFSGMFIALVTVATFINVPFPGAVGGLVHLGTLVMLIIALKFGKTYGALAGGIGMFIFDVLGGWMAWAPGTLVIRLVMGFVVGYIAEDSLGQGKNLVKNIIAFIVGGFILVGGYYIFEAVFISTFEVALSSIMGNVFQLIIGSISLFIIYYIPNPFEETKV